MVRATDAIGRRITTRRGGRDIGKVKNLIVDPTGVEVIGLVLSEYPLREARAVLWSAVQVFGPDSVVIDTPGSVVKASREPDIEIELKKKTYVERLRLLTTGGKKLGKISDFSFDETTGVITGYELTSRLFSDSIEGNPFLPSPPWIGLGKNAALVAPESVSDIRASAEVGRQSQTRSRRNERSSDWKDRLRELASRRSRWSPILPRHRLDERRGDWREPLQHLVRQCRQWFPLPPKRSH
jgi:uncharacterized protein YrrD